MLSTRTGATMHTLTDEPILNRLRFAGWTAAGLLLLAPLVAMQFTTEVNWTASDFGVFAAMLLLAGGACELGLRLSRSWPYRIGMAVAVGTAFLLVWVNLAVGVIGSENNDINAVFVGVLLLGVIGSALARLRAPGMSLAMTATGTAQACVAIVVVLLGSVRVAMFIGVFAALWLLSAWLFRRAAQGGSAHATS